MDQLDRSALLGNCFSLQVACFNMLRHGVTAFNTALGCEVAACVKESACVKDTIIMQIV